MIRMIAAVRAAVTLLTLLAGPPVLLVGLTGNPLPPSWPSTTGFQYWLSDPLRPEYIPDTARVTAWLLWSLFAATVATVGALRARRRAARVRWARLAALLPGPVQGLAATVLGAATVTSVAGATPAHAAAAATSGDAAPAPPHATTAGMDAPGTPHLAAHQAPTVVVQRGDTLWGIAGDRLGDPHRWTQIYRLNLSRYPHMDGGDHIEPRWRLALPGTSAAPGPPPPRSGNSPGSSGTGGAPHAGHPRRSVPATTTPHHGVSSGSANGASGGGHHPARSTDEHDGMALPGGSWLDLSVAASILAAAGLVWAHRRRRYIPRPPSERRRDPDIGAMPTVVTQIRRGLRSSTVGHNDAQPIAEALSPHAPSAEATPPQRPGADGRATGLPPVHDPAQETTLGDGRAHPLWPAQAHPLDRIWTPAGVGLVGPGAHAAARGILVAALAAGNGALDQRSEVIVPVAVATTLFGEAAAELPHTPRLTFVASMSDALDVLEALILRRSRLIDTHETDTAGDPHALEPTGEPQQPVMLLAETTSDDQAARLAALLAQGKYLGIHAVLLGSWPGGGNLQIAADGTVTPSPPALAEAAPPAGSGPEGHPQPPPEAAGADTSPLSVLGAAEAVDLITLLAEAHTGESPRRSPVPGSIVPGAAATPAAATADDPAPSDVGLGRPDAVVSAAVAFRPAGEVSRPRTGPVGSDSGLADARGVEVAVLGRPEIAGLDPQRPPRKKALELLVYLAVKDGAAPADGILEDLLPEAPSSKAPGRLYTYISDLRAVLRRTGGPGTYVTHPGHRYALNRQAITVDLWRMRDAIRDADQAGDPQQRINALRRATDAYRGPLADGEEYEWIEPYREEIRRQALDAFVALAEALAGDPAAQASVLDTAIRHSRYAEHLYQHAMRARAALGQADAVTALHRDLQQVLAEIDAEPSDATATLAAQLTAHLRSDASSTRGRDVNP